jgi:hypothetical protein
MRNTEVSRKVARIGKRIKFCPDPPRRRNHLGYLGVGERAMLKYKLHKRNRECRCELE